MSKVLRRACKFGGLSSKPCTRPLSLSCKREYEKSPDVKRQLTWSYCHGPSNIPFVGETVGEQLLRTVERTPDTECLVFSESGTRRTFQQLMQEVDQFAAGLHQLGFKKGDRIGIWGPSTVEWVITHFATARIGAILVNINPAYQTAEMEFALAKTKIKGIISAASYKTQNYYNMLKEVAPELSTCTPADLKSKRSPHLTTVIMMGSEKFPGTLDFDDVMTMGTSKDITDVQNISRSLDFDEPINIQFTSGTTGNPKGATLTHHNILNNIRFIGERIGFGDYHHRALCQVPLYHCFGMVGGLLACSAYGSCMVFPCSGYDPALSLKVTAEENVQTVYGTPTMFIDMMAHPDRNKYKYDAWEKGIMAGSPCPSEVVQKVEEVFGCKMTIAYGTTENSPVTFMNFMNDPSEVRTTSVGMPAAFTEAKIVDDKNKIVPVNTSGELCIRGYCVMQGYWEDEEKTATCITPDGWYKTGDLATIDEHGYGRIVGRTKDMIIRGGENIYPAEVEDFLHSFEKIDNVQVFGVPDERFGEEVAAWISVRDGQTTSPEEIREFCKGKIAHFKIPRYIKFVTEFPLTVTRKVQKFKMKEVYSKELGLDGRN